MSEPIPLADREKEQRKHGWAEALTPEQWRERRNWIAEERARLGLPAPEALTPEQWRERRFAADRRREWAAAVEPDPATWLAHFQALPTEKQLEAAKTILDTMRVAAECYQQDHAGYRHQLARVEIQRDEAIRNRGVVGHPPQECGDPMSCPQHEAQYLGYQLECAVETIKALEECVSLQARALQGKTHTAELGRAITRGENAEAEVRMLKSKVRFYEDGRKKLNLPVERPDGTACLLDLGDDPDDHASHPHARV